MKDLKNFILEKCSKCEEEEEKECKKCKGGKCEEEEEKEGKCEEEAETEVKSEKDFRSWAESKFKEVFKDDFDEKKMKDTINGFLKDNKELVDKGEWGELVGMMNASFSN